MVMWQDLNGGRCSMGDACANPPAADGVYKMLLKNFDRHYTTNRYVKLEFYSLFSITSDIFYICGSYF